MRTHQDTELLNNTLQSAQSVVLGKRSKEVLDNALLILVADVLLEFLDDGLLVRDRQ